MIQIKLKYTRQRIEDPNLHISWGDIVGDVSGNTALQDALDNKQNVGDYATHNDLSTVEDSLQNAINEAKDDINDELDKKANKSDVYTKEDADSRFQSVGDYALKSDLPDLGPYAKTIDVERKLADKLDVTAYTVYDDTQVKADIAKKADKTYVDSELVKKQDKGNYALSGTSYTKQESDAKYMKVGDVPTDVYTKQETDAKLSKKLDITAYTPYDDAQIKQDIAKKADKTYVDTELGKKQDKGNYVDAETYENQIAALQDALDNKQNVGDYATHNDLSTVEDSLQNAINQTKDDINGELDKKQNKGNYALQGDSYTKQESDAKYALKGDVPTDVYTKTQVDNKLADKLDTSAYTPYDDTQVKADIVKKADKAYVDTELTKKQDKGNYALSGSSYTKQESDAKYLTEHQSLTAYAKTADVNTELAKKQDKGNYVSATTLNDYALKNEIPSVEGLASETYVSNKIKEVVGTAPEALDTLGEIADKLSGDDDAIAAINQVLDGKVSKDEYNTNQQVINNSLTDLSNNKADKSEIPTIPLFKTINGQEITGSTDNIVIKSGSDIELPISSDNVAFFSNDLEVKSELHIGDTFTSRYIGYTSDYGYEFTLEFDGGYEIWMNEPTIGSFKGFESVTKNGSIKYNGIYYQILDLGKEYTLTLTSMFNEMSGESNNYAITLGQASKSLTNALNGLSFWKGTQEEYDAITTKDDNTIYYII